MNPHGHLPPRDDHADQGRAHRRVGPDPTVGSARPTSHRRDRVLPLRRSRRPRRHGDPPRHRGSTLLQVPLTYRDEPLDGADDALITEMQHSVLGTRWVYDGLRDPLFVVMLAAVAMTGQGEALGMAVYDGRWYIAPSNVRIQGGGWTQERVPVDGFELESDDATRVGAPQRPVRADRVPAPGSRTSPADRAHRDLGRTAGRRRPRRGAGTLVALGESWRS